MDAIKTYKSTVPTGKSGIWSVQRFEVSKDDELLSRMQSFANFSSRGRFVPAGQYTRLMRGITCIMSDTPDEIRDHRQAVLKSAGKCLVNGLGLGVVADLMLSNPKVDRVTIIEKSDDVLKLVAPHFAEKYGNRVEFIHADAMDYQPKKGERFAVVWHDIWDGICESNLEEMKSLHRRYGRRCDWQGSWARDLCERRR
jgi:hypothetical protein